MSSSRLVNLPDKAFYCVQWYEQGKQVNSGALIKSKRSKNRNSGGKNSEYFFWRICDGKQHGR